MVPQRLRKWFEGQDSSINNAYQWFLNTSMQWPWKPIVSKAGIVPKHRFAFWMFAHKKFLTRDRQVYIEDKSCALCGLHDETFAHLFFQCNVTKAIWNSIKQWLGINKQLGSAQAFLRALRGIYRGSSRRHKRRIATIAATIYHI